MPEQFVTTRIYLNIEEERYIYMQEATEEIQSIWESQARILGVGSITRISSQVTRLMNGRGVMRWCIETQMRLVCTDTLILRIMRYPQSYYRKFLTGTVNEVLSFWTWHFTEAIPSNYRNRPLQMSNGSCGGSGTKSYTQSESLQS